MQTLKGQHRIAATQRSSVFTTATSFVAHAAILLLLVGALRHAPQVIAYKFPGTTQGTRLLTFYSPGSVQQAEGAMAIKTPVPHKPAVASKHTATTPAVSPTQQAIAEKGTGSSAQSGFGDGDISIALGKHFPHPAPDLSTLPHGTRGDVILDAVIDEQGNIASLTLLHGLGPAIDDAVIATVKTWTYNPATRNGTPVRSEQELHFHYEKG